MERVLWLFGQLFRFWPVAAEQPSSTGRQLRKSGSRKVIRIVFLTLGLLAITEGALQVRSHFKSGDSIFNLLFAETRYIQDEETGLQLLRPNRVFTSNQVILRTNSLGLRSPEIPITRTPGSWRIAVLGASTVMGAYAADNEKTFSARLEQRLSRDFPGKPIEVINAGIVGYGLDEERKMLEKRIAPLKPDLTIVYTGFNDFQAYCRENGSAAEKQGLPLLSLPSWLMTVDMLKKNTVFLRTTTTKQANIRDPDSIDLGPFHSKLEILVVRAAELGMPLVFATNVRAYRPDQPIDEQMRLSETDRYYNHCFDLKGLHVLYDRHNADISAVAAAHGIPVVPLDELIPGKSRYFADSHHFSAEGEVMVADALADFLLSKKLLPH